MIQLKFVQKKAEDLYLIELDGKPKYSIEVHEHPEQPVYVMMLMDHYGKNMLDIFVVSKNKTIEEAIEHCCKEYEDLDARIRDLINSL